MPTLLLTRPEVDSAPLAQALSEMGINSILSPLMNIEFLGGATLDFSDVQGLLFTSANGVRALAQRNGVRDVPVFAVGDATARAAEESGFENIKSASGDVDALAALVARECAPDDGRLLHIAGKVQAGDLAGLLRSSGFDVRREVLYSAEPAETLSDDAVDAIRHGGLDGVVVFSPRTSRILGQLIDKKGLLESVKNITLFALSQNVSAASGLNWRDQVVADMPTQESLLKAVRACYY